MNDWISDIENALCGFISVAGLARTPVRREDMDVEYLNAPHKPPSRLPKGKMAVYGFWHNGEWLKIGIAGPNSNARYTSQHYNPSSAQSTLAGSLIKDTSVLAKPDLHQESIGDWIRANCHRVNILLDSNRDILLLRLLESFLLPYLRPRYEK